MFEHLDKNIKKSPDPMKKYPTMLLKAVVSSPPVTKSNKPTKILKIPLPPPVRIKKKFLDIQGILNDDPIIINPNKLYFKIYILTRKLTLKKFLKILLQQNPNEMFKMNPLS